MQLLIEKYLNIGEDKTQGLKLLEGYDNLDDQYNLVKLYENTNSNGAGGYQSVAFPIIKRTYDNIITKNLVTYHSIDKPVTSLLIFYPKVTQRNEADGIYSQPAAHNDFLANCVGFNCPKDFVQSCKSYYARLYDDSFYDQSKGDYEIITATGDTFSFDNDGCIVDYVESLAVDNSVRGVGFTINGFQQTILNRGLPFINANGSELTAEEFITSFKVVNVGAPLNDLNGNLLYATGDEVDFRFVAQKYGQNIANYDDICSSTGELLVEVILTQPLQEGDTATFDGYIGMASGTTFASDQFAFTWKRYTSLEGSPKMSEFSFDHKRLDMTSISRATRANWSLQFQQDLKSYQGIDANVEMAESISQQIALEIDREILIDLKTVAPWVLKFDYLGWRNSVQTYNQEQWNQKLMTLINTVSGQIAKATNCGGANWVVLSPEASALFPDLSVLKPGDKLNEEDRYNIGVRRVGTLGGRYDVYIDAFAKAGDILIGYKGKSLINPGYLFSPYELAYPSETVIDPNNFSNTKMIMTRNAKKVVNSNMYGRIKIDNIPTFDNKEIR
mgnify:CR=1 FL=1